MGGNGVARSLGARDHGFGLPLTLFFLVSVVSGCDRPTPGEPPDDAGMIEQEAPADPAPVEPDADLEPLQTSLADPALVRRGKLLFLRCSSCHTVDPDGAHLVGPNLYAVVGAPAAQKPGFAYSAALQEAGLQ